MDALAGLMRLEKEGLLICGGWFWVVSGGIGWYWVVLGGIGWYWVVFGGIR